jgi:hypothetical protein
MSWNYRVMKRKNDSGEYDFGIYEVYYDDNGEIISSTVNSMTPVCPSEEDLAYELTLMQEAFKKETLIYKED